MAELAAEAAAAAAVRKEHIREETRKLSERGVSAEKEEEETVPISQSDDIHDIIKERGVHHLDLTSKLPWLKEKQKKSKKSRDDEEESVEEKEQRVAGAAEAGASQQHAVDTEAISGDISFHNQLLTHQSIPTNHTPSGSLEDIQFQLHGDGMESGLPPLPAKDYDSPLDLPPRDYPVSPDHVKPLERTGDHISDDDYYAQMMNVLNS